MHLDPSEKAGDGERRAGVPGVAVAAEVYVYSVAFVAAVVVLPYALLGGGDYYSYDAPVRAMLLFASAAAPLLAPGQLLSCARGHLPGFVNRAIAWVAVVAVSMLGVYYHPVPLIVFSLTTIGFAFSPGPLIAGVIAVVSIARMQDRSRRHTIAAKRMAAAALVYAGAIGALFRLGTVIESDVLWVSVILLGLAHLVSLTFGISAARRASRNHGGRTGPLP